jgi:hypothetical protein
MAVFFKDIRVGTVVSFRYQGKNSHDRSPMVMVIAFNYLNKLHGLNVRYLSPDSLAKLQWIFKSESEQQRMINPFIEDLVQEKEQSEQNYKNQVQQQMINQPGVILKPQQGFGSQGQSSFGGLNTFGRTQVQQQQIARTPGMIDDVNVPSHVKGALTQDQVYSLQKKLSELLKMREASQAPLIPYGFYHQYVKPILFPHVKDSYRKYDHPNIQTLRLVKESSVQSVRARTNFEREIQEIQNTISSFYNPPQPQRRSVAAKDPLYSSRDARMKARKASQTYWAKKRANNQ